MTLLNQFFSKYLTIKVEQISLLITYFSNLITVNYHSWPLHSPEFPLSRNRIDFEKKIIYIINISTTTRFGMSAERQKRIQT